MAKNKGNGVMETVIAIAGEISPTLGKTLDSVNKQLSGIDKAAAAASAAVVAIGTAAIGATKHLADMGQDFRTASNDIAASTGLAGQELESMKQVMKDVYGSNFGDDLADVADGVSTVYRNTKLLGDELADVTKGAYALSDTFGYDLQESSRAAKAMMENFGVSGETALSMIAAGAQNGLDFSGELLDTISEYSVHFAKFGFSADAMFNILQEGADNGAWNLDKTADAIKEFSIRAIDGSKTTRDAYVQMGYDADEVMAAFASGGENAAAAFQVITQSLMDIEDPVKRDAVGVELFGTMWEDLGVEAVAAMSQATGATYDTRDALASINAVKYDDLHTAMEGIKRKAEAKLMPAAEKVAGAFMEIAPKVEHLLDVASPVFVSMADSVGPVLTSLIDLGENGFAFAAEHGELLTAAAIPLATGLAAVNLALHASAIKTKILAAQESIAITKSALHTAATWAQTSATTAWNVVCGAATTATTALGGAMTFLTGPIGIACVAIGAIVAAGVLLYKNWDTVKEKAGELGDKLDAIWSTVTGAVTNMIDIVGEKFPLFGGFLNGWWQSISDVVGSVKGIFTGVIDFIDNVFAGNWSGAWDSIVDIFGNVFGAIVGIAKAPINGVIGIINGAIDSINGIGFDIPDWVPLIGGKKFSVNIPNLPMLGTGGFTAGPSISGEAGTEAVISFNQRYREQNLSYWAKAGQMLGAAPEDFSLSGSYGGDTFIEFGGFNPQITINGDAKKQDVLEAIREAYPEFIDMMREFFREEMEPQYV